ncbi:Lysosomal Pro-X carboxypeptidase [Vitis vinifera]|uniref:Lysosomal Pro-X carboxypeptidase n=1 Tax=Vitis vinifera TaxID=29760 RepID=A0A438F2X8_VITVI|nr:Lysosomal Pro-X carboxypeptidase [Vitis vinifera]
MAQQLSLLLSLLLVTAICVSAMYPITARFGAVNKLVKSDFEVELPPEFVTYYYNQTLDHFNYKPESYRTFQQRYIMNSAYWGGANSSSPIFVYTGDEASITAVAAFAGFIVELASRFNGLLLYIEHRYYGDSVPFGSKDEAFSNTSTFGYFTSTQALADYAELITNLKKNLSAENCPVIAIGGSYGGMLASWFRLKYPHIVIGALASSAPILYFDDITPGNAYHVIVTKDFRETSESCYSTIRDSWSEIDKVAAEPNGLANLSQIFMTCEPLNSSQELKYYLALCYVVSAQNDNPPAYPVKKVCDAIDGAPEGTDIIGRVAAGLNASVGPPCHFVYDFKPSNRSEWIWQTCTEMVMPIGHGANDTMFQAWPFDLNNHTKTCQDLFGVTPRPRWITTEFGGHDIKSVVGNFASNIIFSNGLRDPYSAGGVLQDISDSVVAIYTDKGAHCLDLSTPTATDPDWLVSQQEKEVKIIGLWLAEYNARLISKADGRMG